MEHYKAILIIFVIATISGCSNNCKDDNDPTAALIIAMNAVAEGEPSKAMDLIKSKFDVNSTDACGDTLLHFATIADAERLALALVNNGADTNIPNALNQTPVFLASTWSSNGILRLLLESGANPNTLLDETSRYNTALLVSVLNNNPTAVRTLIDNGADIDYTNDNGITAISLAKVRGYTRIIDFLENKKHGDNDIKPAF